MQSNKSLKNCSGQGNSSVFDCELLPLPVCHVVPTGLTNSTNIRCCLWNEPQLARIAKLRKHCEWKKHQSFEQHFAHQRCCKFRTLSNFSNAAWSLAILRLAECFLWCQCPAYSLDESYTRLITKSHILWNDVCTAKKNSRREPELFSFSGVFLRSSGFPGSQLSLHHHFWLCVKENGCRFEQLL